MGEVIDEDSGEPVACPYCGKEGECPHLLAIIDRSFLEVSAGKAVGRARKALRALEHAFERRLAVSNESERQSSWGDWYLDQLWETALESQDRSQPGRSITVDRDIFYEFLGEFLEKAGGRRCPGRIVEEGGPGFTSLLAVFHARSPSQVLKTFDVNLTKLIGDHQKAKP